jgi:hypothetical protein
VWHIAPSCCKENLEDDQLWEGGGRQHDCSLTVQKLYAIYIHIITPETISQGHVHNGRRNTFSWSTLYKFFCGSLSLSLSIGPTAQSGPRPPSRVSSILPGLGRLLSSFYALALLHSSSNVFCSVSCLVVFPSVRFSLL